MELRAGATVPSKCDEVQEIFPHNSASARGLAQGKHQLLREFCCDECITQVEFFALNLNLLLKQGIFSFTYQTQIDTEMLSKMHVLLNNGTNTQIL